MQVRYDLLLDRLVLQLLRSVHDGLDEVEGAVAAGSAEVLAVMKDKAFKLGKCFSFSVA